MQVLLAEAAIAEPQTSAGLQGQLVSMAQQLLSLRSEASMA